MTFEEVLGWCRANRADVRGVYRGNEISISHTDQRLPHALPALSGIFHWDLKLGDLRHPVSASDMERLVSGKMTLEGLKSTIRGRD
jgi:hypothetical protein